MACLPHRCALLVEKGGAHHLAKHRFCQDWFPHSLLRYEGYIGRIYYNKQKASGKTRRTDRPRDEWVQVGVPAIIEDEVFQAVQGRLARHKALAQRNRKYDYLFIGGRAVAGAAVS
jgi:hypothetical protein